MPALSGSKSIAAQHTQPRSSISFGLLLNDYCYILLFHTFCARLHCAKHLLCCAKLFLLAERDSIQLVLSSIFRRVIYPCNSVGTEAYE